MAYTQSSKKVFKGQSTNKAAGLMHGDSMAYQTGNPEDETTNDSIPAATNKKQDTLKVTSEQVDNVKANLKSMNLDADKLKKIGERFQGIKFDSGKERPKD